VAGLEDVSGDNRSLSLNGVGVIAWIAEHGVEYPEAIFAVRYCGEAHDTVIVARVASDAVTIQGGARSEEIARLENALGTGAAGVFYREEQTTTLRLSGPNADTVWAQTCGVRLSERPCNEVVYTTVAGVSSAVIPEEREGVRSYRIWVDYSYAPGLWRTLAELLGSVDS
jgi:heterotetrameric sarcosine oxidase gamma subunit